MGVGTQTEKVLTVTSLRIEADRLITAYSDAARAGNQKLADKYLHQLYEIADVIREHVPGFSTGEPSETQDSADGTTPPVRN